MMINRINSEATTSVLLDYAIKLDEASRVGSPSLSFCAYLEEFGGVHDVAAENEKGRLLHQFYPAEIVQEMLYAWSKGRSYRSH